MTSRSTALELIQGNPQTSKRKTADGRKMLAAAMRAQGKPIKAIAEELKVKPNTVSKWFLDPELQEEIRAIRHQALRDSKDMIRGLACRAVEALAEGLESGDAKVRINAAKTILDRVGLVELEAVPEETDELDYSKLETEELYELRRMLLKAKG